MNKDNPLKERMEFLARSSQMYASPLSERDAETINDLPHVSPGQSEGMPTATINYDQKSTVVTQRLNPVQTNIYASSPRQMG